LFFFFKLAKSELFYVVPGLTQAAFGVNCRKIFTGQMPLLSPTVSMSGNLTALPFLLHYMWMDTGRR